MKVKLIQHGMKEHLLAPAGPRRPRNIHHDPPSLGFQASLLGSDVKAKERQKQGQGHPQARLGRAGP